MPTCRAVIQSALLALKVITAGEGPHVNHLTAGLTDLQDLILELHEARGPLFDVDVSGAAWTANENTRCRVEAGSTTVVTAPNAVPMSPGAAAYDYGFAVSPWWNTQGSTGPADGVLWRSPNDGARIEIVGATQTLLFYRADLNEWVSGYDLRLDDETPLNARYRGAVSTLLAERLAVEVKADEPGPAFLRRVIQARAVLFTRPGTRHEPARAEYF